MKLLCPIAGMFFRPPAKTVLAMLGQDQALVLQRQPENPHDPNAVQVMLPRFNGKDMETIYNEVLQSAVPEHVELGKGQYTESMMVDPLFLGYVGAKTGHAEQVAAAMDKAECVTLPAKLTFGVEGGGMVEVDLPE